jgi:heme oxygenase
VLTEALPAGALLARLRFVTRPAHDKLEGTLGLLDERLGLDTYRRVLERFYGFWRGWEPQVAALVQDAAFLDPRRRMHLLRADLATVGLSAHAVQMLPACPLPILRDAAEALGSLYVMEGSTLGGRVIERNVKRYLGLDGRRGCTYFAGYGTDTGRM